MRLEIRVELRVINIKADDLGVTYTWLMIEMI